MNYKDFFKDKKVTQLGLGLLGRGLNDAIFMLESGVADLIVTDKKTAEDLVPSAEKLKGYKNLRLRLGEHNLSDFENRDFILKGAGVPLDSEFINHAKEKGIPIEMDASLFTKLLPEGVITIGVTGTRGKSTVTHLIAHILRGATSQKVWVGGNIRDMATLPLLEEVRPPEIVVLELDSWQLQGFGESRISPHVAVFTTFMDDHLNYYEGNREKYFDDKANIYRYQNNTDFLILGEGVVSKVEGRKLKVESKIQIAKKDLVPKDWKPKIIGVHNLLNISCAVEACRALGVSDLEIKEGVESFGGVEGRLQFVKEVNGIKIWNDNNATTPEATIVALNALTTNLLPLTTVLICGGSDKNLELEELIEKINDTCKAVILLPGTGSEKLTTHHLPLTTSLIKVQNLEEAIKVSLSYCELGDNLLFSPGFASFGMFKNEYERNDRFLEIVSRL